MHSKTCTLLIFLFFVACVIVPRTDAVWNICYNCRRNGKRSPILVMKYFFNFQIRVHIFCCFILCEWAYNSYNVFTFQHIKYMAMKSYHLIFFYIRRQLRKVLKQANPSANSPWLFNFLDVKPCKDHAGHVWRSGWRL